LFLLEERERLELEERMEDAELRAEPFEELEFADAELPRRFLDDDDEPEEVECLRSCFVFLRFFFSSAAWAASSETVGLRTRLYACGCV